MCYQCRVQETIAFQAVQMHCKCTSNPREINVVYRYMKVIHVHACKVQMIVLMPLSTICENWDSHVILSCGLMNNPHWLQCSD